MKSKIIFLVVVLLGIGFTTYYLTSRNFFIGNWQAVLNLDPSNYGKIHSLTYKFEDTSFSESSNYNVDSLIVNATIVSHFNVIDKSFKTLTGYISKKEITHLNIEFNDPKCATPEDCVNRDKLKADFENMFRKTIDLSNAAKEPQKFKLVKVSSKEMLIESGFNSQRLIRK